MARLFKSYSRYTLERIGTVERVLICERATDGVHYVGHNKHYEHVLVPPCEGRQLEGHWADVRITSVSKFYMKSELVGERQNWRCWGVMEKCGGWLLALIVAFWLACKLLSG